MKKNLLLISLDTVRADVAYSGKFEYIEKIRGKSTTFLNTVSSAPLTPVSHATVLTGLQPYNHGMRHLLREKINDNTRTLAQILRNIGYSTGAIVSCPGMNSWYGFYKGFEHYDDEIPRLKDGSDPLLTVDVQKRGTALKRANVVVERAERWLNKNKERTPFFLFLHFFDAHWPYESPKKFCGENIYEEEVAYSVYYMGSFLNTLEKDGIMKDTTVVIFSDHGEDLCGMYQNDKGGDELGHPEELGHGCLLYNQTQKVLLIIKDDKMPVNRNIEDQARLVDIVPTILDLLEIDYDLSKFDGKSLLGLINGEKTERLGYSETFYPEERTEVTGGDYAYIKNKLSYLINNKYKIIIHMDSNEIEFYDLRNDPNELNNLA